MTKLLANIARAVVDMVVKQRCSSRGKQARTSVVVGDDGAGCLPRWYPATEPSFTCEQCEREGLEFVCARFVSSSNSGDNAVFFVDADGRQHRHDYNVRTLKLECNNGHMTVRESRSKCPVVGCTGGRL